MNAKERRDFRRAARVAMRRAVREGTMTRLQRGRMFLKMRSNDVVEEMADVCLAQAIECKVLEASDAGGGDVNWVGIGENIDWEKLAEFIMTILPMFL